MSIPLFREQVDMAWQDDAACRGEDPDLFFPERGCVGHAKLRQAQAICEGCAVRSDCLEYALHHGENAGVWGGLSGKQLVTERRRRWRAARAGAA